MRLGSRLRRTTGDVAEALAWMTISIAEACLGMTQDSMADGLFGALLAARTKRKVTR